MYQNNIKNIMGYDAQLFSLQNPTTSGIYLMDLSVNINWDNWYKKRIYVALNSGVQQLLLTILKIWRG